MQVRSMKFKARAEQKFADRCLQQSLTRLSTKFVTARTATVQGIDFPTIHEALKERRDHALEDLDVWLTTFEAGATRCGARVLFARTTTDAARLVTEITRQHDVKKVIKSRSMVTEETRLNQVLGEMGMQNIGTDLGEYILQINDSEPPSHIIAPIVHKDKEEIAGLFTKMHKKPRLTDIPKTTCETHEVLRPGLLSADMGMTGGNLIIAGTSSIAIVTNEGNEGMCTIMPRVHVAVTGIEKVLPALEDLATVMCLLPRSATGQAISNYFSLLTGPRAPGEKGGPDHIYFIIADDGRSGLIGGEFQEILHYIWYDAYMNHCPVYQKIGDHACGWMYPGPMDSVLTPSYVGLLNALDLSQAAILRGECNRVCPASVPLSDLLRTLHEKQMKREFRP